MTAELPARPICLDASLPAAMLLPEPVTAQATAAWRTWIDEERRVLAPPHFAPEVMSAIRRAFVMGRITAEEALQARRVFLARVLPKVSVDGPEPGTWDRAWALAEELRRSNVYVALYLAVAEDAGAEFWTADGNLVRALEADGRPAPGWVHLMAPVDES